MPTAGYLTQPIRDRFGFRSAYSTGIKRLHEAAPDDASGALLRQYEELYSLDEADEL